MQTTTDSTTEKCAACKFWQVNENSSDTGQCRRRAPQTVVLKIDDNSQLTSVFPATSASDWCGDFQAR